MKFTTTGALCTSDTATIIKTTRTRREDVKHMCPVGIHRRPSEGALPALLLILNTHFFFNLRSGLSGIWFEARWLRSGFGKALNRLWSHEVVVIMHVYVVDFVVVHVRKYGLFMRGGQSLNCKIILRFSSNKVELFSTSECLNPPLTVFQPFYKFYSTQKHESKWLNLLNLSLPRIWIP